MANTTWSPILTMLGAALLVSSCATGPAEAPEPTPETAEPTQTASAVDETETADQWDADGDWDREWDENRPDELKSKDVYHLEDGWG